MPIYSATNIEANGRRPIRRFAELQTTTDRWIAEDTAMLIVHGIGNQVPLATLDSIARGIAGTLERSLGRKPVLEHRFEKVAGDETWFNNYIRITREDDPTGPHLDLYEYYWAHEAHDRASLSQIRMWIRDTVRQGMKFYKANGKALQQSESKSFFLKKNGQLRWWRYSVFLTIVGQFIPVLMWVLEFIPKLLKLIPYFGTPFSSLFSGWTKHLTYNLANVIGDVVVYNTSDAKSEHYDIRRKILTGAVRTLRSLIEPKTEESPAPYGRVILAGHSLGSQIGFDTINRLNMFITQGDLRGIDTSGKYRSGKSVAEVLSGFVTFGSPLDKIAFFLRQQSERHEYIRRQMLANYHCFKQRKFDRDDELPFKLVENAVPRLFEDIRWVNYHDRRDYVSGSLDFYENLVNVDCDFQEGRFYSVTHGMYWDSKDMFTDILEEFILPQEAPRHLYVALEMIEVRRWRIFWRRRKRVENSPQV